MEGNTTPKGSVSFRDSDVEFLQTQAREWLEAMLGEKLEQEKGSLAEILANGAILYKVSQVMKELIRTKLDNNNTDILLQSPSKMQQLLASPDVVSKGGGSGKNSQKYLPYSYVEAFLKVSKDMVGLLDVDLFNPSDAVDMKDIRRVCVCLRRLSKKARAQQLPVPDFDNVAQTLTTTTTTTPIHKLAMPTEFVHGLKESLQKSASKSYYDNIPPESDSISKETSSTIANLRKPEKSSVDHGDIGNDNGSNGYVGPVLLPPPPSSSLYAAHEKAEQPRLGKIPILDRGESTTRNATTDVEKNKKSGGGYETAGAAAMGKANKGEKRKNSSLPWFPVLAGVVVFVGTFLALTLRAAQRSPAAQESDYEVRKGDTLSLISRHAGKGNWQELVHNNPHISNPDLIYPSERLKL